jgi:DNA-directed RNA polymerase specialized sigma24 family protein
VGRPGDHSDARDDNVDPRVRQILVDVQRTLRPHEHPIVSALALDGVPIDMVAERLGTTRGGLHQTLQEARRKLRAAFTGPPTTRAGAWSP